MSAKWECSEVDGGPVSPSKQEKRHIDRRRRKHLVALSHIVKKMAENKLKADNLEELPFLLDVNDYQMKRIEELRNVARMSAQRVIFFKRTGNGADDGLRQKNYPLRFGRLSWTSRRKASGSGFDRRVVIKPII